MSYLKNLAVSVRLLARTGSVLEEEIFLVQVPYEICHTTLSVKYQKKAGACDLVLHLRFVRYYNESTESTTRVVPVGVKYH